MRGNFAAATLVALGLALSAWWLLGSSSAPSAAAPEPAASGGRIALSNPLHPPAPDAAAPPSGAAPASAPGGAPLSPLGLAQRQAQQALAAQRLERAREALTAYQRAARYPHESRPIEEHADQVRPFDPITEDQPLRMAGGGSTAPGVRLRTTQERVFAAGAESSRVTVSLVDEQGQTKALRITRANLHEVTPPGQTARTVDFAMPINDAGVQGDLVAGDGIFSALMHPAAQGFAGYAGLLRLDLQLEYAGQPGFIYFDLVYSPEQAAQWLPGVRDTLRQGSLEFLLPIQVLVPGRYVVSGRIDDAQGRPFALSSFNAELASGAREVRLLVHGRLVLDKQPALPLQLRDVDAFLLKPDTYPDRSMLPRRAGVVHRSSVQALDGFSAAEWASEERTRYLTELTADLEQAERRVKELGP